MRVLQISGTFPPGRCGVGDYTASLARALTRLPGLDVAVLTRREGGRRPIQDVPVLECARSWRLWELPRIVRAIRGWQPDLVHIHWPSQGFGWRFAPALVPRICRASGIRVVQTWHEPWLPNDTLRFRLQRRATAGLVFVRPNLVSLMPRSMLPDMPRCPQRIIGSGPSLPLSTSSEAEREALRRGFLGDKKTLVVYFGFVYPKKGVERLFEIADPVTDAIVLAGGVLDRAYGRQLREVALSRGWGAQLHQTGYLEPGRAADLLRAADAVVLPYVAGGGSWSTSIHSALMQGTLVITTSAQPEGDDPIRNLFTAGVDDVEAMRQALRTLAGRRIAPSSEDGWEDVAGEHARFYRELIEARQVLE